MRPAFGQFSYSVVPDTLQAIDCSTLDFPVHQHSDLLQKDLGQQATSSRTVVISASDPAAGHHRPMPSLDTPGLSLASLGYSLEGSLLLSPESWCTRFCLCPLRVYFPVLCKFWQLCGEVNGNLFQEGLCHTQIFKNYKVC